MSYNGSTMLNTYNGLGQRIKKSVSNVATYFAYDESGHLIGEYDQNRNMIREYIWLGERIVGMYSNQVPNTLLRVYTDHLGTIRAVSKGNAATRQVLWRFDGDAFGDVQPTNPTSTAFTMPIRMPGQYYDSEVGISYNYFRDYDASTGRYVESDPIGLKGGLNTYGYVGANALGASDSMGLLPDSITNTCLRNPVLCQEAGLAPAPQLGALSAVANAAGVAAGSVAKDAKCDAEPDDLCMQLALAEAKAGAGEDEMGVGTLGDEPRLVAHHGPGPWVKRKHQHTCANGRKITIHYFHSRSTWRNEELKIKGINAY